MISGDSFQIIIPQRRGSITRDEGSNREKALQVARGMANSRKTKILLKNLRTGQVEEITPEK